MTDYTDYSGRCEVPDVAGRARRRRSCAKIGPLDPSALGRRLHAQAFAELQERDCSWRHLSGQPDLSTSTGSYRGDPLALYAAAASGGQWPVTAECCLRWHALAAELARPNCFLPRRDGAAIAKPMKGTRPRGRDAAEDAVDLKEELVGIGQGPRREPDDRRSDPQRSCRAWPRRVAVKVDAALRGGELTRRSTPWSLRCARGCSLGWARPKCCARCFPCGSITGAPKIRAMELIDADRARCARALLRRDRADRRQGERRRSTSQSALCG